MILLLSGQKQTERQSRKIMSSWSAVAWRASRVLIFAHGFLLRVTLGHTRAATWWFLKVPQSKRVLSEFFEFFPSCCMKESVLQNNSRVLNRFRAAFQFGGFQGANRHGRLAGGLAFTSQIPNLPNYSALCLPTPTPT